MAAVACTSPAVSPTATATSAAPTQQPATPTSPAGATTPRPSPTASAAPTATPTQAPAQIPGTVPQPQTPKGTVVIGVGQISEGGSLNRAQRGEVEVYWGAAETLFTTASGPKFGQMWLAKSWDLAADLSKVTISLQQGVQFHKGYGEMTADDVVWSINDANSRVTSESIHAQAGDLAGMFGPWTVVDRYTVDAPFVLFDPRWMDNALSDGWQPTAINSKAAYDKMGADWLRDNVVATGPFEVEEWVRDDRVLMNAVTNHWRKPPAIQRLTYRAIPEDTTREAALETGEVDVATVALKDAPGLISKGYQKGGTQGGSELNIPFGGNLWEKTHASTGAPLERKGFDTSKPWIGDPDNASSMEKARLVRWALSMAIDREALAETVGAGLSWPTYIAFFNPIMPQWQDKWKVPYDPQKARDYLNQAGYPNGFDITIFGQSDTPIRAEIANAVAGFWRDLGLRVTVESYPYQTFRPSLVERSASTPFVNSCDDGRTPRPWDWPVARTLTSLTRGGFSCALEDPFIAEQFKLTSREPDTQKRIDANNKVADHLHQEMLVPGTITFPVFFLYNPRSIQSWDARPSLSGPITAPENIVPAR